MNSLQPVRGDAAAVTALLREWDAADAEPEPLVIETSGSTGRPKRVMLSRRALRASAEATHARLGGPGQWVLNLPPTYVAGVQVLFRSVRAGVEPVVVNDADYGTAWEAMQAARRYVALVPTQLYRALEDGLDVRDLGRYDAVLVGGGPLEPRVRAEAERYGIRIVQTYGMSETCGGCVYDGVPLDGVEMRISHGSEVQLRGGVLFDGYEDEPERTAAALDDGWLRTNDLGGIDDGVLRVAGRADDVIISGGLKIPAQDVERALERHPSIRFAFVCGTPDEEWGEVVTVVAVVEGSPPTDDDLRPLLPQREWLPRRGRLIDEIPLLSNGKPDRAALKRMALDA